MVVLLTIGLQGFAQAISFDARKIAMGGALLPYHSESYILNPAFLDVEGGLPLTIPIPIGLFLFLGNLPSFDPNEEDFDTIELANLVFNPPFYLELRDIHTEDSTEIFIDIAEDHLLVDLDEMRKYMPTEPIETGLFDIRGPRMGYTYRDIHFGVSPYILMDGRFEYSENFEDVLASAAPFEPNTDYTTDEQATVNAGVAINAGYAFELQDHFSLGDEPRVLVGVNGKYIMGFLYGDIENHANLHMNDPIFGSENPPDLRMSTRLDYAIPESGDIGPKGHGFGLDLGLLLRFRSIDIGFGIQDVYTRMNWRVNRERFIYDEEKNDVVNEMIFEDRTIRAKIPRTFAFTAAYRNTLNNDWEEKPTPGDYLIAYNMEVADKNISMHIGGETYYGPWPVSLRFGTFNQGDKWQVSFGAGIPLKFLNFDIALSTHSRTIQMKRGVTLATSISFP